jgi:predicted RNA polymerase sigma factor
VVRGQLVTGIALAQLALGCACGLADARDMCEQGLIAHPRGRVRAALFYDLGRVLEAQSHAEQARDAYVRSLELRENETVRAHLEALPAP